MNFTRNGKIAHLPRAIRAELNQRLAESEPTESLLAWLNALPEVQQVLTQHFAAQPISEQNLSAWRQGGFAEWERAEGAREWAERLVEDCQDLEGISGQRRLAERMAVPVLMELMQLLQTASTHENLSERRRTVLGVARQITQLTRAGHETERLEMERARWKYEEHQKDVEEVTKMTTREQCRQAVDSLGKDPDADSPEPDDSEGDFYFPGTYLGEENGKPVFAGINGAKTSNPSSRIKVHQGHQGEAKATDDPRELLRNHELETLRTRLMSQQAMAFSEIIVGNRPHKKTNPRSRSRSSSSKKTRKTKGKAQKQGTKKKAAAETLSV